MKQIPEMNWHGWVCKVDANRGIAPVFSRELQRRVNKKLASNTAVVGEAGIGKSYMAIQMARILDPNMTIEQVVFTYSEYLKVLMELKMGKPIVFDEPSYAMGKREWYKQVNQALVKTMESQRFMVKPLFISVININLLDKTIRFL